jgi:hypothetical protein
LTPIRYNALIQGYGNYAMQPQLPQHFNILRCVPVSKEVLPPIRVSGLMPEGHGKCTKCGIEATHVITYTLSTEDNRVVYQNIFSQVRMMTADHVLPKALGGRHGRSNLQLMCVKCNGNKGCQITSEELELVINNKSKYLRPSLTKRQVAHILKLDPGLDELFSNYFQLTLISEFDVCTEVATVPFMHARDRIQTSRSPQIKHPHHPFKGWQRIFQRFPELESQVSFS